jgi:hypothetical protein
MYWQIEARSLLPSEFDQARHLVYQVYVLELGWHPDPENRSGIRLTNEESYALFTDWHDPVAKWYGVFEGEELIGCCRTCSRLDGSFEVERYHEIPTYIALEPGARELNRYAVKRDYRTDNCVFLHLYRCTIEDALASGGSVFSTTGFNNITRHLEIGMIRCDIDPFRYEKTDPHPVELVSTTSDANTLQGILTRCNELLVHCREHNE